MREVPLRGGRVTEGVVRVGDTVRRPRGPNSNFVGRLLAHLHDRGFDAVPRYLGTDDRGRDVFSFLVGDVPPELSPRLSDESLSAAARLIKDFHEATAGAEIAGECEVVCHNDLSPCNFVFRAGMPVAMIDFDAAAPGDRLRDLGYALFLWLNLGTDGPGLSEQARRSKVFCHPYGSEARVEVVDAVIEAVAANVEQLRDHDRIADTVWWQSQLDWLTKHRNELIRFLA